MGAVVSTNTGVYNPSKIQNPTQVVNVVNSNPQYTAVATFTPARTQPTTTTPTVVSKPSDISNDYWAQLSASEQAAYAKMTAQEQSNERTIIGAMLQEQATAAAYNKTPLMEAGNTAASIANGFLSVPRFLYDLANPDTWVRVGEAILGLVCIMVGIAFVAKDMGISTPTNMIARTALKTAGA